MKLFNPFKWHVISKENCYYLRIYSLSHFNWVYYCGRSSYVANINVAKQFYSVNSIATCIEDYHDYFKPKKKPKAKFLCTLDKV